MTDTPHGLTEAEWAGIWRALRACRVDDGAPVSLLRHYDQLHVRYMVKPVVERILADRLAAGAATEEWCRICSRAVSTLYDHDGAAHDARAAGMPSPAPAPTDNQEPPPEC